MPFVSITCIDVPPIKNRDEKAKKALSESVTILDNIIERLEGSGLGDEGYKFMNKYFLLNEGNRQIPEDNCS